MYCSKCKFTSYDHLKNCPKCNFEWEDARKFFNFSWLEPSDTAWSVKSSAEGSATADFDMDVDMSDADDTFMQEVDLDDNEVFTSPAGRDEDFAVVEESEDTSSVDDLFAVDEQDAATTPTADAGSSDASLYDEDDTIEVEATTEGTEGFSIPELDAMFGPDDDSSSAQEKAAAPSSSDDDILTMAQDLELEEVEDLEEVPESRGTKKKADSDQEDEIDAGSLLDSIDLDLDDESTS